MAGCVTMQQGAAEVQVTFDLDLGLRNRSQRLKPGQGIWAGQLADIPGN